MFRNFRALCVRLSTLAAIIIVAFAAPNQVLSQTSAATLKPLRVQYYPGLFLNQTVFIAYYNGIFKKHGLDVTLVPAASGPATEAALHADSIDIGSQDLDQTMINTHLQNLDFLAICGGQGSFFQIVASPAFKDKMTGPLTYPAVMKNFVGKKLGVTALGADANYFWEAAFIGAGLPPDSGTYVATGVGQTALSALEHGFVDATMSWQPLTTIAGQNGAKTIIDFSKGQGPPLTRDLNPALTYIAKKSWLNAHSDVANAFNASLLDAVKFQQDPKNFPQVLAASKKAFGPLSNAKGFDQMVRDNIPVSSMTAITPASVKAWLEFAQAFLKFPKDVTPEAIYKEVVWSEACK